MPQSRIRRLRIKQRVSMKCCRSIAVAALVAACAALAHVNAQTETPTTTPTPSLGPAPGTLGASEVAGIPIPGTPAASSASSSSGQKPGSTGTTTNGSFNQDVGSSSLLPGLDDAGSGDDDGSSATASKLTGSTDAAKATTPTPSPTSAASHAKLAFGAISTAAAVVVTTLFV